MPSHNVALLAGAGDGAHRPALVAADRLVRIPIDQRVDSLGVGHAAIAGTHLTAAVKAPHTATTVI